MSKTRHPFASFYQWEFFIMPSIVWHTSCANSSSPTAPPPLCPPSPPPYPLIEILPGTQTLPILGTKLRERERESGKERNTQEPVPIVWCPLRYVCAKHSSVLADQGTSQSNRYFPASASCDNLLQFQEFCLRLSPLCVF